MASRLVTVSDIVLGKRKARTEYVLRLTSSPEPTTASDSDEPPSTISHSKPIIVNGVLVEKTRKRYKCTFSGCDKAYGKPSRLAEHERTHTGEVYPNFVGETYTLSVHSGHSFAKLAKSPTIGRPIFRPIHEHISLSQQGLWLVLNWIVKSGSGPLSTFAFTWSGTTVPNHSL